MLKVRCGNGFAPQAKGRFNNLEELKQTFRSVDYVRTGSQGLYVFDIAGNRYRLITAIHFNRQRIFIRAILTHSQYDKGD